MVPNHPLGLAAVLRNKENSIQLTAVFKEVPEGFIGFVEVLSGANTQGETLEEARENLREPLQMLLDAKPLHTLQPGSR